MELLKKYARYEDFGALGDGKHDDLPAIVACHEYANKNALPVRASDDAEYYIGGKAITAKIMTDTSFGKARFTIDDRVLEDRNTYIFEIASDAEVFTPDIKSIKKGQKKLDFPHTGTVYVRVEGDPEARVYIRKGLNMNSGSVPAESFIVDGEGNILSDINWNYPVISSAMAKSVDDKPITVEGGIFTTIANQWECRYDSHKRGFNITRSHVTVKNIEHYVTGELPDHGAPYGGFISIGKSYDVTLRDLMLTPRFTYMMDSKVPGQKVCMGTYDLLLTFSIGTKLLNIKQSIEINDGKYWGLMGSNYCKDMVLEDCVISRFDAHCGVTNCTIKNCVLGHTGINLIGFGEFNVENTTVRSGHFLCFRPDYGSTFDGSIKIRNCTWIPSWKENDMEVFTARNSGDHDFGYECRMGKNIIIDGLFIDDGEVQEGKTLTLLPTYDSEYEDGKPYSLKTPDSITIDNLTSKTGREFRLFENPELYRKTEIIKH